MKLIAIVWAVAVGVVAGQSAGVVLGFGVDWEASWERRQMGGAETRFRAMTDDGREVLRAESRAAATAVYRPVVMHGPAQHVSWSWKVAGVTPAMDESTRAGDDYAARLFVIFGDGGLGGRTRAICYVWATAKAVGSTYRSPYVNTVATIVLQSGDARVGDWVVESRDIAADYRRVFGAEPEPVGAVALMVDTDDTGATAVAWFGAIRLR